MQRSVVQGPGGQSTGRMFSPGARAIVSGRIPEFLETLKNEFDTLAHDNNLFKAQRDDYERKMQTQASELNSIQQTVYDLDRTHGKLKQQYEEEISRLRRQLEAQSGTGSVPSSSSSSLGNGSTLPPFVPGGGSGSTSSSSSSPPLFSSSTAPSGGSAPAPRFSGGDKDKGSSSMMYSLAPLDSKRASSNVLQHSIASHPISTHSMASAPHSPHSSGSSSHPPHAPHSPHSTIPHSIVSTASQHVNNKRPREELSTSSPAPSSSTYLSAQPEKQPKTGSSSHPVVLNSTQDNKVTSITHEHTRDDKPKGKKEDGAGTDFIVGYNPGVQTNLNIELAHNLEHPSVVCCVKFSNDGKCLATGCNRSAQVYDIETGAKIHMFAEDPAKEGDLYIRSVCFSPDNRFLAAGAEDKTVKLWSIEQKKLLRSFSGHDLDIYSLDYSRDGTLIVSGSGDKKAKIWNTERGECLFTLGQDELGPKDGVTSVAFSPDGKLVAAGSLDRIVRLWDAHTGFFMDRFEGHLDSVYSVAFSPDGKTLASGSLDRTLKLWDLSSRPRSRCRSTFSGHKDFVLSVAFSPDGNWLISGSKDRSVQFWDPRTAVTHMMLQGHKNSVISVAVSPTGRHFATGSGDNRARIWKYE